MANDSPGSDSGGAMATLNGHMDKLYNALTEAKMHHENASKAYDAVAKARLDGGAAGAMGVK